MTIEIGVWLWSSVHRFHKTYRWAVTCHQVAARYKVPGDPLTMTSKFFPVNLPSNSTCTDLEFHAALSAAIEAAKQFVELVYCEL
jgi:hypothetical protein